MRKHLVPGSHAPSAPPNVFPLPLRLTRAKPFTLAIAAEPRHICADRSMACSKGRRWSSAFFSLNIAARSSYSGVTELPNEVINKINKMREPLGMV